MSDETQRSRRSVLRAAGTVAGMGAVAGCTGSQEGDGTETEAATETSTTATDTETTDGETTDGGDGYSVAMEPVGTVDFEAAPETWVPYTADYADMGVALGHAEGLAAIGVRARFGSHYYDELPGVSVDKESLTELWQDGTDKEVFYELDADLHLIDPNFMVNRLQWDQSDVDEVTTNVAPFVGNTVFTRAYGWHDYRYYSLYEAFEKVAEIFQERERYEAFAAYHDEVLADVRDRLPEETPDIAILYPADVPPESFYPYRIGSGTQSKHWNDLGVGDALAKNDVTDAQAGGGTVDYETLLDIDPDVIAIRLQGEITDEYLEENVVSHLREHNVAGQLRAVENDRVIYGGLTYQGPILHLFQFERAAQGLYPDEFDGEQLFDRERVADIVRGEF